MKRLFAAALLTLLILPSCSAVTESETLDVSDFAYEWVFDYSEDMQLPELPNGCEATAAATLARMNGEFVTKTEVADIMPRSSHDFVHAFLGNPYLETGWATSAPCVTETLNRIFQTHERLAAIELTGTPIYKLPLPCMVWVSIDLKDNGKPKREQEGYVLFKNTHTVIVTNIHDVTVEVIDPLRGETSYPIHVFKGIYDNMGRQAVYISDINTISRMNRERIENDI